MGRVFQMIVVSAVVVIACSSKASDKPTPAAVDDAGTTRTTDAAKTAGAATAGCEDFASCKVACDACGGTCTAAAARACHDLARLRTASVGKTFDLAAIARLHIKACAGGHLESCAAASIHHMDGRGVPHDPGAAERIADKACRAGAGVACMNLASWYRAGILPIDDARAAALYRTAEKHYRAACDRGELGWCMNLGVMYENGFLGQRQPDRAAPLYAKACAGGSHDACANQVLIALASRASATDVDKGLALLERTCRRERNWVSCGTLGQLYIQGRDGVPRKPELAADLLGRACDGGISWACGVLGAMFAIGQDVPKDITRSLDLQRRGCDLGSSKACYAVAIALRPAGASAHKHVAGYLRRACQIGDRTSCALVAAMIEGGVGVKPDAALAGRLRSLGCRLGQPDACAAMIRRGVPLPLPPRLRALMRQRLCQGGLAPACQ